MNSTIKELLKRYLQVVNSPENERNKQYWEEVRGWNRDKLRPTPGMSDKVPFVIKPDNSLFTQVLNIGMDDYYENPEKYLEVQLRMFLYHHENFKDNYYFTNELYVWFSVVTELGLFNTKIKYFKHKEPWIEGSIIKNYEDLDKIDPIDFYKGGIMPKIHKYYEVIKEYAGDDFKVMFPEWVRGPFCIASHLRGVEDLLMDTMLNPEFVHKLMRFIVNSNKEWNKEREKFTKEKLTSCRLWNDEIDSAVISGDTYREFIFPYEKELSDYYGSVRYWHSCGKTDEFMKDISQLTNLRMFHCSPWSSAKKAVETFNKDIAFDVCINPQADVYDLNKEEMEKVLIRLKDIFKNSKYAIRADTFMVQNSIDFTLNKIKDWNEAAIKVLSQR